MYRNRNVTAAGRLNLKSFVPEQKSALLRAGASPLSQCFSLLVSIDLVCLGSLVYFSSNNRTWMPFCRCGRWTAEHEAQKKYSAQGQRGQSGDLHQDVSHPLTSAANIYETPLWCRSGR